MTTLAFLQNQWFKDPERAQALYARHPEHRERFVRQFLFSGCLTGDRLVQAFGNTCREIIWEEISKEIGGYSDSVFLADMVHIKGAIAKHKPEIILAFGKPACAALCEWRNEATAVTPPQPLPVLICGPHPAARFPEVFEQLEDMSEELIYIQHIIFGIASDRRYSYDFA